MESRNAFSSSMRRNLAHDSCVQLDAREDPWGGCFRFRLSAEREGTMKLFGIEERGEKAKSELERIELLKSINKYPTTVGK